MTTKKKNYNIVLRELHSKFVFSPAVSDNKDLYLNAYTMEMQHIFPGKYDLEEYFDSKIGKFSFRLKFESEEDETIFLLKYAD